MASDQSPDDGIYRLAPEEPIGVSPASACSVALDGEKRRAVKGYLKTLGPSLREKYGRSRHYTPAQVRDTVLERGLSIDYSCWAYLLYCSAPDFERIHTSAGEVCDYAAMRETVAAAFFGGNAAFNATEVAGALASGTAEAFASGVVEVSGWLADVDWSGLLDWS